MQYQFGAHIFTVGDRIRSFDFPNNIEYFMEGIIISIENGMIEAVTTKVVRDGATQQISNNAPTFRTPEPGQSMYDDMFPNFERITLIENV